jgi:hypothetical protein
LARPRQPSKARQRNHLQAAAGPSPALYTRPWARRLPHAQLPRAHHTVLTSQLKERLERAGLPFAGAVPEDPLLSTVR